MNLLSVTFVKKKRTMSLEFCLKRVMLIYIPTGTFFCFTPK